MTGCFYNIQEACVCVSLELLCPGAQRILFSAWLLPPSFLSWLQILQHSPRLSSSPSHPPNLRLGWGGGCPPEARLQPSCSVPSAEAPFLLCEASSTHSTASGSLCWSVPLWPGLRPPVEAAHLLLQRLEVRGGRRHSRNKKEPLATGQRKLDWMSTAQPACTSQALPQPISSTSKGSHWEGQWLDVEAPPDTQAGFWEGASPQNQLSALTGLIRQRTPITGIRWCLLTKYTGNQPCQFAELQRRKEQKEKHLPIMCLCLQWGLLLELSLGLGLN